MHINVAEIKKAVGESRQYHLKREPQHLKGLDDEIQFIAPLELILDVTNCGTHLEAKGTVKTVVKLTCGRCLEQFDYPLAADFNEKYVAKEAAGGTDQDLRDCITFEGDHINLLPEVMAAIRLALPMRQVCRDDCQGLCAKCGTNLNHSKCDCADEDIDPRMAVLQDLLKK